MTLYFLSGLGADSYVFRHLTFPTGIHVVYLNWIDPQKGESLADYASRLVPFINTKEGFSIIGLSMGGMVAVELAKIVSAENVLIISSASTYREIPLWYRLAGKLQIHRLLPLQYASACRSFVYWFMGARKKGAKELVDRYLDQMNVKLMKWSIDAILRWDNRVRPGNLLHIHGDCDKIIPFQNTRAEIIIAGGSHLMVLVKAKELSLLINKFLAEETSL